MLIPKMLEHLSLEELTELNSMLDENQTNLISLMTELHGDQNMLIEHIIGKRKQLTLHL